MIIDCHVHDRQYSSDSLLDLQEAVKEAKRIGLDGICVTNHDNNLLRKEMGDSAYLDGVLVIVGAEVLTFEGDILTFGLKDLPEKMVSARELLHLVKKNKGIAIAAHPFRNNNRGMGNKIIKLAPLLAAVEAFNGSTYYEHNLVAYKLAGRLNLPVLGASDAHRSKKLGAYATFFANRIRDHQDFIEAVKSADYYPVMRRGREFVSACPEVEESLTSQLG